jgi:GNAT superfamily N-acetyltransferase
VLIAIERLLIKVRQPKSRADELIALRRRLRDELARDIDDEERALARDVHARKLAVAAALHSISSCRTCATGQPWPRGGYDGGDCCSGVTANVFDDHEPAWRRRGIGRGLLERVEAYGRKVGASHVWLETSNVNVPGVAAYNRLGYTLCGADRLYYGSYMPGETAIYLAKML